MLDVATIAFYLGVIAYSAAATLFFLELVQSDMRRALVVAAPRLLAVGALFHATHVVMASLVSQVCPVESLHFGLSVSALMAVGAYLVLGKRLRMQVLGVFIAPVALTFLVGAEFVGHPLPPSGVPRSLLAFHITANVLGVGLFLIAGAAGAFYLVQEHRLKTKHWSSGGARLPPLDSLERITYRLLLAGFPLLTVGVVTGAIFSERWSPSGGAELLRTLFGYASWVLLALVLLLWRSASFRGRRAAYGTLAGVLCMLIVVLLYAVRAGGGSSL